MAARIDGVRSTSQPTSRHRPIKQHLDGIKVAPIRASKPWQTQRSAAAKSLSNISVPTCGDPDPPSDDSSERTSRTHHPAAHPINGQAASAIVELPWPAIIFH
ncbi:hypothetical protein ACLOJK_019312 [Asimina triloba]